MSGAASAATGPTSLFPGYGFDGNAHLIVGGGSTTLYKLGQSLATLWNSTESCAENSSNSNAQANPTSYPPADTPTGAAFNECLASPTGPAFTLPTGGMAGGNYDGDTVAIANPTGSSAGIASLNGDVGTTKGNYAYEGTNANLPTTDTTPQNGYTNGYGSVDFALSSRAAKTSGGNCPLSGPTDNANDELACDTFWGIASDGVEVMTFGSHEGLPQANTTDVAKQLTASDLYKIWSCQITNWDQLGLGLASAPIVPWGMNSSSGTYATFISYLQANGGAPSTFTPNSYPCDRELSSGQDPLENDIKPIVNDAAQNAATVNNYGPNGSTPAPAGLSASTMSVNNPSNWIWYGSYGLLSAFPYTSQYTYTGAGDGGSPFAVDSLPAPMNGILPSSSTIFSEKYPILRVLNLVTTKADATCPLNASNVCDFDIDSPPVNGNGVTDINVEGASTGVGGAVREFVRFICRDSTGQEPIDPYTGVNTLTEIDGALAASGFDPVPVALRSIGSSCDVVSNG